MEFAEACSEIEFILEHLKPSDKEKIPESVFNFFRNNKAIFYKVNLTTKKSLIEQDLKDETKAFLQIIHYKYFASQEQKENFKKILKNDDRGTKKELKEEIKNIESQEVVIYKENIILKILKRIKSFFYRK